jgi:ferredoxin
MRPEPTSIPHAARRALGVAGYRRLERAAAAILPPGGALAPGAADLDVAASVARSLAGLPRPLRLAFRGLLAAWELAPLASRFHRPFSRLGEAERAAFAEEAAGRAGLQGLLLGLKIPCIAHYTAHPRVSEILGFDDRCIDGSPPRPGPRLKPIAHPEIAGGVSVRADVVVIGSGAGGAVVAKELAERGISVIVVEEGAYFVQEDFRGSLPDRFQKLYRDGGTTLALGRPFVSVPLGKAVGGTTVVNSGTCFRAPDRVLREWESRWGIEGASPDALGEIFDRVERTMHVKPVPEELLGENARVFRRGAEALGMHGAPMRRNIDGCRGCGVCAFGCPSDAKRAMHLSYLPLAEAAGARIYARCRVRRGGGRDPGRRRAPGRAGADPGAAHRAGRSRGARGGGGSHARVADGQRARRTRGAGFAHSSRPLGLGRFR